MSERSRAVAADVARFVAITVALSSVFASLILRTGHIASGRSLFTRGLMWSPGLAALILMRWRGTSWRDIGWRWTGRWEWISYGMAMSAGLAVYGLAWMTGISGFPDRSALASISNDFGWRNLPDAVVVGGFTVLTMTLGMLPAVVSALGEEIGWRGYLVPRLSTVCGFTTTSMITGTIWAAWHYPMFVISDYNRGGGLLYSLTCFTAFVLAGSVICTWLRLKSGSIWPGVMLHAANNLFVQDVLTPLSVSGPWSRYVLDQFGCLLPILAAGVAYVVWRRRADVEIAPAPEAEPSGAGAISQLQPLA
ncbi:MAG: CPBP family intramembrane glutamic endopeptidase [Gemmatimonadaceae bacterium]